MVITPPDQSESRAARRKRMVAEMSNVNTLKWIGVALVLHVVLIVATSFTYLRTHVFSSAKADTESTDSTSTPPAAQPAPSSDKPVATPPPAATVDKTSTPAAPSVPGLSDDDKKLNELKNNPEVKKITATAKPGELPKSPSLKGIDDNP